MSTSLLNVHLVLWLITMFLRNTLDRYTKYRKHKLDLNKIGTFSKFLWNFAQGWDGEKIFGQKEQDENKKTMPPLCKMMKLKD